MTELFAARLQMAVSLGFHIIFAVIGMTLPFLMVIAHRRYLKTRDELYLRLTKAWMRGFAIFFATGAVSGTVLSFELGLLWPTFMQHAGPIFGMPFSLEGTAFFIEAIFLGIYLYGWGRMNEQWHWASGVMVGISGVMSGFFVVCANAFMNAPAGFDWVNGEAVNIDQWAAMFNDAFLSQTSHMIVAAFQATGFAVAGIHAFLLLRDRSSRFHLEAVKIALVVGALFSVVQPFVGHFAAQDVAKRQPLKLAAAKAQFTTQKYAPIHIGGVVDMQQEKVTLSVPIPGLLSFLATNDFAGEVKGLRDFDKSLWPPVPVVYYAFQVMVGIGTLLAGLSVWMLWYFFRRRFGFLENRVWLWVLALCSPLGFIALEAGWVVTEVGRQPWIIYGVMKTKDALTSMPGLQVHFWLFVGIYIFLAVVVTLLMVRQIKHVHDGGSHG